MSADAKQPRILSERAFKWLLNLYPPMLFNCVRIVEVGPGIRYLKVRVGKSLRTRNLHGSIFGGTIYTAADPFYAMMYWQVLARRGQRVQAWQKSASVSFLKPADTRLTLEFSLSDEDVARACEALEKDGRYAHVYRTEAVDRDGRVCAIVDNEIHLRKPRTGQKEVHAF
jgi:acyl-coenzyme A thioesterase PaaI-like protein